MTESSPQIEPGGLSRPSLSAKCEEPENDPTVVESLCMHCYQQGTTQLLFTKIPHFKEIVVMSFHCPHCGFSNNEIQSAASLQEEGCRMTLHIQTIADLSRQVIKSEYASLLIPCLELELPASSGGRGVATTVDDLVRRSADDLQLDQPTRQRVDPSTAEKIQNVIDKLRCLADGKEIPFDILLDDPSGNSHIQPLYSNESEDAALELTKYTASVEQLKAMGFNPPQVNEEEENRDADGVKGSNLPPELQSTEKTALKGLEAVAVEENEKSAGEDGGPMSFESHCDRCGKSGYHHMIEMDIPGFRRVLLMSFVCDRCGNKSSEVKAAGAYGEKGRKWTLRVESSEDLNRDVLKADYASIRIPELEFEATPGTFGGMFTTVEDILLRMADSLEEKNPFILGDSSDDIQQKNSLQNITKALRAYATDPTSLPFTFELDDAADHSYIGRRNADFQNIEKSMHAALRRCAHQSEEYQDEDRLLTQEIYTRTYEQDEELGINDMRTENY